MVRNSLCVSGRDLLQPELDFQSLLALFFLSDLGRNTQTAGRDKHAAGVGATAFGITTSRITSFAIRCVVTPAGPQGIVSTGTGLVGTRAAWKYTCTRATIEYLQPRKPRQYDSN